MVFKLKITGPKNLDVGFQAFAENMKRYGIQEPVDYAFKQGEQRAKQNAPVKTGRLRDSIHVEKRPNSTSLVASTPYAKMVDDRTGFFTNAAEGIQRTLPGLVQRSINEQAGILGRKFLSG